MTTRLVLVQHARTTTSRCRDCVCYDEKACGERGCRAHYYGVACVADAVYVDESEYYGVSALDGTEEN